MKVHTIGFTKKSAAQFFETLRQSGAKRVVDVRLHNVSQLAGFAKKDDLEYFLRQICGMEYVHLPELAPTKAMLDAYRKEHHDWDTYQQEYLALLDERRIAQMPIKRAIASACLLCSEATPEHCHRRLAAEYLNRHWGGVEIVHLV